MENYTGRGDAELSRNLRDPLAAEVRLARVQKFKNWLECEIITKAEGERPSAYKIYLEFMRLTGISHPLQREFTDER